MISVIIPTRNRADLLATTLESLTRQTIGATTFEVLVVDNGSQDKTADVVQEYVSRLPNLRYFLAPEPGLHIGRHRGLRESNGEVLVFADDDIEALPTWLAAIQRAFSNPEVAMMGGNNLPRFVAPPPAWLTALWQLKHKQGIQAIWPLSVILFPNKQCEISPFYIWGCNFAIRKDVLLAAGGFHPDGMPKDKLQYRGDGETHVSRFVAKAGLKCVFDSDASIYHLVTPERMTFGYFRLRGFSQGVSDSYTNLREMHLYRRAFNATVVSLIRLMRPVYHRLAGYRLRDSEAQYALRELDAGYAEGYAYHQHLFKTDSEIRAWVLKESYL